MRARVEFIGNAYEQKAEARICGANLSLCAANGCGANTGACGVNGCLANAGA